MELVARRPEIEKIGEKITKTRYHDDVGAGINSELIIVGAVSEGCG